MEIILRLWIFVGNSEFKKGFNVYFIDEFKHSSHVLN